MDGESLAVLSGIKSNKMYLYGCEFKVVVDHRPLVPDRPSSAYVDRHRSKLLGFNFRVVYEPSSAIMISVIMV